MKVNEIVSEATTDPRVAGGVPQAVANLKSNYEQRKINWPQQSTEPAQQSSTNDAPIADTGGGSAGGKSSGPGFMSSMMRGMGANQAADAIDSYNKTKGGTPGSSNLFANPNQIVSHWEMFKQSDPRTRAIQQLRPVIKNILSQFPSEKTGKPPTVVEGFQDSVKKGEAAKTAKIDRLKRRTASVQQPAVKPTGPAPTQLPQANTNTIADIQSSLKSLGYSSSEIKTMMTKVQPGASVQDGLKQAMSSTAQPVATPQPAAPQAQPTVAPTAAAASPQPKQQQGKQIRTNRQPVSIFSNPVALQSSWDEYIKAGGKFTPEVRSALKDIWMNMGGIKVESIGGVPWKVIK